jgi:DNA-binding YbaB/EbfC family protein
MGSGFSKMKKQARMMQEQFGQIKEKLASKKVEGTAGGGLVKVTLNGERCLTAITINPECLTDVEGLQDLIVAAFSNASEQLGDAADSLPFSF